jgi:D-alanyl-D-alanine dipeptidase
LLTVVSEQWSSVPATLRRYEATPSGAWTEVGAPVPVVLGKSGLGWGRGIVPVPQDGGPRKQEGDGRSPAGVFALTTVFGYAPPSEATWVTMPYVQATSDLECVDDPASSHYNQLVRKGDVQSVDWTSSEMMKRPDALYRWGVFVAHNTSPTAAGAGSCIFLHLWRGLGSSTVGCTAGDEPKMKAVFGWLDPKRHPALVQLPQAAYAAQRKTWALP